MSANQRALGVGDLKATAVSLGMDGTEFTGCLDEGRHADDVTADLAAREALGI